MATRIETGQDYTHGTVKKALQILQLLVEEGPGLGTSTIARRLLLNKSTAFRLLEGLREEEFVDKDPQQKKYRVGARLSQLAAKVRESSGQPAPLAPVLSRLRDTLHETVFVGGLIDERVTILEVVEAHRRVRISGSVGTQIPLFGSLPGLVVLAAMDDEELGRIIDRGERTAGLPPDCGERAALLAKVRETRRRGYVIDSEEYQPGVRAVGAPLRTRGMPMGLWVAGFAHSLDDRHLSSAVTTVVQAAHEINRQRASGW